MGAPVFSVVEFLGALQSLLPSGRAWNTDRTSVQAQVEAGLVASFQRVNVSDAFLLVDAFPSTAVFQLPEWEEALGLPDPCAGEAPTIAARQQQVVTRFTDSGGMSKQRYIDLAASLGFTVTITEFAPFRAGHSAAGDPLCGEDWWFVWQVTAPPVTVSYFRAGFGAAGEPLATWGDTVLECSLRARAPAHTIILFKAPAVLEVPSPDVVRRLPVWAAWSKPSWPAQRSKLTPQ